MKRPSFTAEAVKLLAALGLPATLALALVTRHGVYPFRGFPLGFLLQPIARLAASTAEVPQGKILGLSDKRKSRGRDFSHSRLPQSLRFPGNRYSCPVRIIIRR